MKYAEIGGFNVVCMVCREVIKSSQATKRWDGLIVGRHHEGCMEYRHPSEIPRPPLVDDRPLPFTSAEPTDEFIAVCTVTGRSGVAGYGVAGCAIAGQELSSYGLFNDGVPTGTFSGAL